MANLSSPTLDRLLKEVRITLRQPSADNSTWSDAEIIMYLNDAVRVYFLEVLKSGEGQFDATADLDLTSADDTVPMPDDCFQIKALYRKDSSTYTPLVYKNNTTVAYTQDTAAGGMYYPYYYLRGNDIVLRPIPGFTETAGLRIEYTAFPETVIWGGDVLTSSVSPLFKEMIIFYAVYKCKLADDMVNGSNTSAPAVMHLGQLFKQFKETVSPRSLYPQFVTPFNPE